jgi:hypothetical protein
MTMNTRNLLKTTLLLTGLVLANATQAGLLGGSGGGALGGALGGSFGRGSQGIGGTMDSQFGGNFDNDLQPTKRVRDIGSQVNGRTDSAAQAAQNHGKNVAASSANDIAGGVNGLAATGNAAGNATGNAAGNTTGNAAGNAGGNAAGNTVLPSMPNTKPAPSKPEPSSPPQPQPQLTTAADGNAQGSVQRTDDRHVHAEASDGNQASASASH